MIEPFAGSAAMSLASLFSGATKSVVVGDSLVPLAELWTLIIEEPEKVVTQYTRIWDGQTPDNPNYFNSIRSRYNEKRDPVDLLYLLARCVKNAPRFNAIGNFTQSHDKRRLGTRPATMTDAVLGAHQLLKGRALSLATDFRELLANATPDDFVYLDPPWEGTTVGRDKRYHSGLPREQLEIEIVRLIDRRIPFILSYDGRMGDKVYGAPFLENVGMTHVLLDAGRSSQATLVGRNERTYESLYISPCLFVPSDKAGDKRFHIDAKAVCLPLEGF